MNKIVLEVSKDDEYVAYVYLPKHPKKNIYGIVKESIPLDTIISGYKGIPINLDFDSVGELVGIEIVG